MDRTYIANLIAQLETPDPQEQRVLMDELILEGAQAVDTIVANLALSSPRVKASLVQILEEIGDDSALLPLMRYVWDSRGDVNQASPRGLAMRAIVEISGPQHGARMLGFLMDTAKDEDRFVRGWVAEALGRFGDPAAEPLLKDMLTDEDTHVRESAEKALVRLSKADGTSLDQDMDADTLLGKIRQARGGQQEFFMQILRKREDVLELCARLVREGGRGTIRGLHLLRELDDPRARLVAGRFLEREPQSEHRAVAFSILTRHLDADADSAELELIRSTAYDTDPFVRLASVECAALSGDEDLIRRAVEALFHRDLETVHAAARGLSKGLRPTMRMMFPRLVEAFDRLHRMRLKDSSDLVVRSEAFVVRATNRLVAPGALGLTQARDVALRALFDSADRRPLVITGLELLESTTPDVLASDLRWNTEHTRSLASLLDTPDRAIRDRTLTLLWRGGASGVDAIVPALERILFDTQADLETVVKVLEVVNTTRSRTVLTDIAQSDSPVGISAQAALKRLRDTDDWIEAEFDEGTF